MVLFSEDGQFFHLDVNWKCFERYRIATILLTRNFGVALIKCYSDGGFVFLYMGSKVLFYSDKNTKGYSDLIVFLTQMKHELLFL